MVDGIVLFAPRVLNQHGFQVAGRYQYFEYHFFSDIQQKLDGLAKSFAEDRLSHGEVAFQLEHSKTRYHHDLQSEQKLQLLLNYLKVFSSG